MISVVVILIISIAVSLYVIMPLLRGLALGRDESPDNASKDELCGLEEKKDMMISEIMDIELDYQLGKLNPQDYSEIKNKYRLKAAELLKQIESIKETKSS